MPTIRPYRDVNEHDVINLFTYNPTGTYPALKGQFVKIISGWTYEQNLDLIGDVGYHYNNVVSQRYGLEPYVAQCTNSGDAAIGLTLYDVREVDENGERLVFHPSKQAQMNAVLSGQAVPIAFRGTFLYSGVDGFAVGGSGTSLPGQLYSGLAGAPAYLNNDGGVTTSGTKYGFTGLGTPATRVGTFLGPVAGNGWVLLRVSIP